MTLSLEEAIKILGASKNCEFEGSSEDLEVAYQLGIEALKWVKDLREWIFAEALLRLPSETKE